MNWRVLRWVLAGAFAYLVFLLATLPASYATGWLQRKVPEVQFTGVGGSLWAGSAQEVLWSGESWGGAQWHFDWAELFRGHLGFRLALRSPGVDLQARVAGSARRLLLRDVAGRLGLQRIAAWLPLPAGSVSGELRLHLAQVTLVRDRPTYASGTIDLTQLALSWPQALTLGSYQLKLQTPAGSGIQGTLLDTSGPLALQGTLQLSPDGHYQVSGSLGSRDAADTALNDLLHYVPADAAGNHRFSFSGQW